MTPITLLVVDLTEALGQARQRRLRHICVREWIARRWQEHNSGYKTAMWQLWLLPLLLFGKGATFGQSL